MKVLYSLVTIRFKFYPMDLIKLSAEKMLPLNTQQNGIFKPSYFNTGVVISCHFLPYRRGIGISLVVVVILRYYYLIMQYEKSKENLSILKSQSVLNEYLTLPYTQKLFMSINFRHLFLLEVANFKCC